MVRTKKNLKTKPDESNKESKEPEKVILIENEVKEVIEEQKIDAPPTLVTNEQCVGVKEKKKKEAGIIYLSRIPNRMNVKIIREYFGNFGQIDRIYLEPREKKRKNQARSFSEGWVEFKRKKVAKRVAKEINNTQVGGKRRNPWYHELWNLKYLKGFRWTHLNERKAYEQEMRKQRLRQEVAFAKKETNFYMQNVENNEKKKRFEKKNLKNQIADTNNIHTVSNVSQDGVEDGVNRKQKTDSEEAEEKYVPKNKNPLYDRKIKVTGNDDFLRQIFSK